jgi:hypothetical protein
MAEWAVRVLNSHGYHPATQGEAAKLSRRHWGADLFVAMARNHVEKLVSLGVPAERIRLMRSFDPRPDVGALDVEDPVINSDIETVYAAIDAALPGLHEWVDAQLAPASAADGWRVWYVRPAAERLTLYGPMFRLAADAVARRARCTRDRVTTATCVLNRSHIPPVTGCGCGMYAVPNTLVGVYLLRLMTHNIGRRVRNNSYPRNADPGMVPVLAQVELRQALAEVEVDTPVLRGAACEVTRVFVTAELISVEAAVDVADRLAASLGVEAAVGYPSYSSDDWDLKPEWMTPGHRRSRYDTLMGGFTRDGWQGAAYNLS